MEGRRDRKVTENSCRMRFSMSGEDAAVSEDRTDCSVNPLTFSTD